MGVGAGQKQSPTNRHTTLYKNRQTENIRIARMSSNCETCSIRFSILKRKRKCSDCGRSFCSACLKHKSQDESRRCTQCQNVINGDFSRQDLIQMKIVNLRLFLSGKNIPTEMCTEKADLIDLILENFGSIGYHRSQFEHGREISRLAEKMQQANDIEGPPRSKCNDPSPSKKNVIVEDQTIIIRDSEEEEDRDAVSDDVTSCLTPDGISLKQHCDDFAIFLDESNTPNDVLEDFPSSSNFPMSCVATSMQGDSAASTNFLTHPPDATNVQNLTSDIDEPMDIAADMNITADGETNNQLPDRLMAEAAGREDIGLQQHEVPKREPQIVRLTGRLEDFACIEQLTELTVRQLKELLLANFVNFKGCCERWELEERVHRLWAEKSANHAKVEQARIRDDLTAASNTTNYDDDKDLCKICMDAAIECVLLECGHMVTCTSCGKQLAECPICRQYVVRVVHTFHA